MTKDAHDVDRMLGPQHARHMLRMRDACGEDQARGSRAGMFDDLSTGRTHEFIRVPFGGPRLSVQTTVIGPSRVFRVHGPFTVSLEYSADGVFASHASLPVHGYGRSIKEALAGFDESFEFQWSCLVEREPADLTEHARELRQRMERAVVSVGPRT